MLVFVFRNALFGLSSGAPSSITLGAILPGGWPASTNTNLKPQRFVVPLCLNCVPSPTENLRPCGCLRIVVCHKSHYCLRGKPLVSLVGSPRGSLRPPWLKSLAGPTSTYALFCVEHFSKQQTISGGEVSDLKFALMISHNPSSKNHMI